MVRLGWLLAVVIAWSPALAGCMGPAAWFGGECTFDGIQCERDGSGWLVEGVEATGQVELRVTSGDHVLLRDVHIRDTQLFRITAWCHDCRIQGEEFTVAGAGPSAWVGLEGKRGGDTRNVQLDGINISGIHGLYIQDFVGQVVISDMTLSCSRGGDGIQFDAQPGTTGLTLRDVQTTDCANVVVSQRGEASPLELLLERTGLNGTGGYDDGNDGIRTTSPGNLTIKLLDSQITNTRYAVNIRAGDSLEVNNSTLTHNGEAVSMSDGATLSMADSVVADNGFGIRVWGGSAVEVVRSQFLRNGFVTSGNCGAGISGDFSGSVQYSTFQGNALGVDARGQGPVDARNNYWGAPTGPTVQRFVMACVPPPGVGDVVQGDVTYLPFLTAPPS